MKIERETPIAQILIELYWILKINNFTMNLNIKGEYPNDRNIVLKLFQIKMLLLSGALAICLVFINYGAVTPMELLFDQVQSWNESYSEGYYNLTELRISKFNRTTYVYNTVVEYFVDIDDKFEMEMNFYYNRLNNNQYRRTLIRVPRENLCKLVDKYYKLFYTAVHEKNITNFITSQEKSPCPAKKVNNAF